jgi:hypothetical protein
MLCEDAADVSDMSLATLSGRPRYVETTERRPGDLARLLRTFLTIDLTGDLAGDGWIVAPSNTLPMERARLFDGLVGGAELRPERGLGCLGLVGVLSPPERTRRSGVGVPGSRRRLEMENLVSMFKTRS